MHTKIRIASLLTALVLSALIIAIKTSVISTIMARWDSTSVVAALGLLFTAATVIVGVRQYVITQDWKRYEFSLQEVRNIDSSPGARNAILMLSWPWRPIHIFSHEDGTSWINIDERTAARMILPFDVFPYTKDPLRIAIYDSFMDFFERLSNFQRLIENGLIRRCDVLHYVEKVGGVIGRSARAQDGSVLDGILACAVRMHLHRYRRPELERLFVAHDIDLVPADLRRLRAEWSDIDIPPAYDVEVRFDIL